MMNDDELWAAIDDQRRRTADLIERLSAEQLEHPSLCEGWTVRHVAAHLTGQRLGVGDAVSFMVRHPSMLRGLTLNRTIHDSAVILAQLPMEEIVARIRAGIGSRKHNFLVTSRETLTDILVHGQDIALPLGLELTMLTDAAAEAASRRWEMRHTWMAKVNRTQPLDDYRLTATDTDWSVGEGPEIAGPIGALLLLLTGRHVRVDELHGAGADRLRTALAAA